MKISLIMATMNRDMEIKRFLYFLNKQRYRDFELIIIDQNRDNRINDILDIVPIAFDIKIYKSKIGLSRARNIGLKNFKGEIVSFPDDDCWYPENLLENVNKYFSENLKDDGLTVSCRDSNYNISQGCFKIKGNILNKDNYFYACNSITVFLRKNLVSEVGYFNENMGLGNGSISITGEDCEYILRSINKGFKISYSSSLHVFHEQRIKSYDNYDRDDLSKAYTYSIGAGSYWRKYHSRLFFLGVILTYLKGLLLSLFLFKRNKARMIWLELYGLLKGYILAEKNPFR